MFRSSPAEVFFKKDALQTQTKPTGEQPLKSAISKIAPTHGCVPRITTSPQENTSGGLLLYVKRVLKDLNYRKLLLIAVKGNLLTLINK